MELRGEVWWLLGFGVIAAGTTAGVCRACLLRDRAHIGRTWNAICPLLRERCELVRDLSQHMRALPKAGPSFVRDIDYLLTRVEETDDPNKHAGVQNGLVVAVQRGLEEYQRREAFQSGGRVSEVMHAISMVDSRLAPLRDSYNERVEGHNTRVKGMPFSIVARLMGATEQAAFPMLIPWWSTDQAAYGGVGAEEIKQVLETWKAPMVVAPSQLGTEDKGTEGSPKAEPKGTPERS